MNTGKNPENKDCTDLSWDPSLNKFPLLSEPGGLVGQALLNIMIKILGRCWKYIYILNQKVIFFFKSGILYVCAYTQRQTETERERMI